MLTCSCVFLPFFPRPDVARRIEEGHATKARANPNEVPLMKYLENLDQLIMEALMTRSQRSRTDELFHAYETNGQPTRSAERVETRELKRKTSDEW